MLAGEVGSGLLKVRLLDFGSLSLLLGATTCKAPLQNAVVIMNELPAVWSIP